MSNITCVFQHFILFPQGEHPYNITYIGCHFASAEGKKILEIDCLQFRWPNPLAGEVALNILINFEIRYAYCIYIMHIAFIQFMSHE